jgi:hypothetical protein
MLAQGSRPVATRDDRRQADRVEDPRLDAYITKVVDAAPPLTSEQRARLAVLLATSRLPPRSSMPG